MKNSSSFAKELAKSCRTVGDIKRSFNRHLQEIFEAEMALAVILPRAF